MTRSAQNAQRPTKPTPAQPINTNPLPSYIPSTQEEIAHETLRSAARAIAQAQHDAQQTSAKISQNRRAAQPKYPQKRRARVRQDNGNRSTP